MPSQKRRIRNRKLKASLENEIAADSNEYNHDSDSSDDIMKDICFSNGVMNAEREIMDLYKEAFNVDPLDRSPITLTSEQRIERCALNIAFWQRLLREYNESEFDTCTSDPKYFYIKLKESEVRVGIIRRFEDDKNVLKQILNRACELMNNEGGTNILNNFELNI